MSENETPQTQTLASARPCVCGRGEQYEMCCEPLHLGKAAPTAEHLMRSRYAAFARGLDTYLLETWHISTRPNELVLDSTLTWKKLLIENVIAGGPFDTTGTVTFTAIARTSEGRYEQREMSRFVREGNRWYYLDGEEAE